MRVWVLQVRIPARPWWDYVTVCADWTAVRQLRPDAGDPPDPDCTMRTWVSDRDRSEWRALRADVYTGA